MELKNILIIEDDTALRDKLIEEFRTKGIEVQTGEPDDLDNLLAIPHQFQLVILDWFLDGDSSDLARVCLTKIRQAYFMPVIIYTAELSAFKNEIEDIKRIFPEACLHARSKDEIDYQNLLKVSSEWHNRTPTRLSDQFRRSLMAAAEESLYKLAEHSEDDLVRGLKTLISMGEGSQVDMEHTIDVLLRLVGRAVYTDEDFIEVVRQTVTGLELQNLPQTKQEIKREKKIESHIKALHMYYHPGDKVVRTGDVVEIKLGEQLLQGIVLTPACDLARPKTPFLRLILIHERAAEDTPGADKFELTFLAGDEKVCEVCFHEILVVDNKTMIGETSPEQQKPVMLYDHSYQTLSAEPVSLRRIQRLDEPYRADLLHSFVSHAGRVGVPEFTLSM